MSLVWFQPQPPGLPAYVTKPLDSLRARSAAVLCWWRSTGQLPTAKNLPWFVAISWCVNHSIIVNLWDTMIYIYIYIYIYDMIWYDMIWCDMIWYDTIWYDMICSYHDNTMDISELVMSIQGHKMGSTKGTSRDSTQAGTDVRQHV